MATAFPRKSSWLALLASVGTISAQSPFWTYTTRFQDCMSVYISNLSRVRWCTDMSSSSTYEGVYSTYTDTTSCRIKSTVTPTATPYSTDSDYYSYDVPDEAIVTAEWYSAGSVPESDLVPTIDYYATTTRSTEISTSTYHVFSMQVTYTAPADCSSQFTFTTNASVSVPTQVINQVTPYAVVTSTPSPTRRTYCDTMLVSRIVSLTLIRCILHL